jgi:hypothetical protein
MVPDVLGEVIELPGVPDPEPMLVPVLVLPPFVLPIPAPPPLPLLLGLVLPVPRPELPVPMPPLIPPALPPLPAPPAACANAAPPVPITRQLANAILRMLVHIADPPVLRRTGRLPAWYGEATPPAGEVSLRRRPHRMNTH